MTVANHDSRNQYTAIAGQTVFTYNFEVTDGANLRVYQRAADAEPDDAADLLTYITDYTVTGVGAENGGTVVLVTGATVGDIVTIDSGIPAERDTTFTPNGVIKAEDLNIEFDNLVLIMQRFLTTLEELAPKYPSSAYVQARDLKLPVLGNNQIWMMDTDVNKIQAVDYAPGSSVAALIAALASHDSGEGASMIGLHPTGTVQDLANATFILKTANAAAPNAQALGALTTGIMKSTTTTGVISISASLTSIDGLTTVADRMLYTTGADTYALTPLTAFARTLLDDTTAAAAAATLAVLPLAGGAMTGNINMGGFKVTNTAAPSAGSDYVNLTYLNGIIFNLHPACLVSTTANLAGYTYANGASGVGATLTAGSNGAFSSDGVSPAINSRIFVPFQSAPAENGIYVLTQPGDGSNPAILTRATDYDESSDMQAGDRVTIVSGTLYGLTEWMMTQTATITVGTTAITWLQIPAGSGALLAVNNLSDVDDVTTSRTNIGAAALGANADITSMSGLTGPLRAPTSIQDANGNNVLGFTGVASAVNYVNITNQATGNGPTISSVGIDATIGLNFLSKGGSFFSLTDTTGAATLRFYEAGNVNYVALKAGVLASDLTFTLPIADGTNAALWSNGSGVLSFGTFASSNITSMTGLTGMLEAPTGIGSAGVPILSFNYHASAVNYIGLQSNQTGSSPIIQALGSDTNILLTLRGKGNQGAAVQGTQTNDDAPTLYVGEFISSVIAGGSAVTFPSSANTDLTSISLTAGDWDVWGNITFNSLGTTPTQVFGWFNTVSATTPDSSLYINVPATGAASMGLIPPARRFSLSATTTIYITGAVINSSGNGSASGGIYARRVR